MKETALYLNVPEPTPSLYGESSQLRSAKPTTGEVIGAYTEEVFTGEGSLSQDIQASNIRRKERRGVALSEEDWKQSTSYRAGLKWYDGITSESAETLARLEDDRQERSIVMDRATGLQTGLGIGASFTAGLFEPKNLASGIAAALVTAGAGTVIPSLGRLISTNTVKGAAVRGGLEGTVAAAAVEHSNIESSKIVQGDYTLADSLLNFGLSTVLGAGIGAGTKALQIKIDASGQTPRAYKPETAEHGIKEYDTALAQLTQGKDIDVSSVKQLDNSEKVRKAQKKLPELNKKLDEANQKLTPVTERSEFKKWFEGSKVTDAEGKPLVVYHGTTADFEDFKSFSHFGTVRAAHDRVDPFSTGGGSGTNIRPVYLDIKNPLEIDDMGGSGRPKGLVRAVEKKGIISADEADIITDSASGINILKKLEDNLTKKGFDGFVYKNAVEDVGSLSYVPFKPEQIKSIFNRVAFAPNDPRLIDVKKAEDLQVKKGRLEADARLPVDQEPITKLQQDVGSVKSTAYNDVIAEDITEDFKTSSLEDETVLDRNLESMQEDIQTLYDQGLLNDEEIKILERLADLDEENAIFDNVLLNAKNCLLR